MLDDLKAFLGAPFPWYLAPMGYQREMAGIARRADQCAAAWHTHLAATKRLIEGAAERCDNRDTALIIGSGLLLDVPLEFLSGVFRRVILADILHPRHVRHRLRRFDNVEPVQTDVTGVAKPVFDYVHKRRTGPLPTCRVEHFLDRRIDLVVSANLLSQLAVIPCRYLKAGLPGLPPHRIAGFGRSIVEAHLAWLRRFPGRVVLVTDFEREERASDGRVERKNILEGVELPPCRTTWTWRIAPLGRVYPDIDVRHRVAAYEDFGRVMSASSPPTAAAVQSSS